MMEVATALINWFFDSFMPTAIEFAKDYPYLTLLIFIVCMVMFVTGGSDIVAEANGPTRFGTPGGMRLVAVVLVLGVILVLFIIFGAPLYLGGV